MTIELQNYFPFLDCQLLKHLQLKILISPNYINRLVDMSNEEHVGKLAANVSSPSPPMSKTYRLQHPELT